VSPRVSVVIPAYQAELTVGAAVESVLTQSYRDFELIVVDDGSTDATTRIVEAHRGPLRLIRQEHGGVSSARNRGIALASGELLSLCDADDFLFERHLEALVGLYDRSDEEIVTANSYWLLPGGIDRSKVRYRGRFPAPGEQRRAILEQNFLSVLAVFPRRLVDEIGGFMTDRQRAEDWHFWMRAIFAGYRVALQREPLALYRWGKTGLSADRTAMDADIERMFDDLEERIELDPDEFEYVRRRRAGPGPRRLGRQGDEALRAGRFREAARLYGEAASLCPSERPLVWKARALAPAPRVVGPLVRARQLRIERRLGIGPERLR
jgi:glycosyltransferase involved in cell wall biosynthesis